MKTITAARSIDAPVETVFGVVSDIRGFAEALPHVVSYEYLSQARRGVGARFRETRTMGKQQTTTELEVTEFVENERVRMVSDNHGTVWDSVFTVVPEGGGTRLTLRLDAEANRLLSRLVNPLIRGMVEKAVEHDLDLIKAHCEEKSG